MERDEQERQWRAEQQRIREENARLNAFLERKRKVIESSKLYPHAFYVLTKELYIPEIPGIKVSLPGSRKSNWEKKKEEEAKLQTQSSGNQKGSVVLRTSKSPLNSIRVSTITRNNLFIDSVIRKSILSGGSDYKSTYAGLYGKKERSIETLANDEYEKLYAHIGVLPEKEKQIQEELHKEDVRIKFEDQILDNKKRLKYYKKFLVKHRNEHYGINDKEYCISNLPELDRYITWISYSEYDRIMQLYPEATEYFESLGIPSKDTKWEYIAANEDRIQEIEKVIKNYNKLKSKYPLGLPVFEKDYAWYEGGKYTDLTIEQIIECEDKIAQCEKNAKVEYFYKHWQDTQKEFSSKCFTLKNKFLTRWGCYNYKVPLFSSLANKENKDIDFPLWQIYYQSYSEDDTVDTSYYPQISENKKIIPLLRNQTAGYNQSVYSKIVLFIEELKKTRDSDCELVVLLSHPISTEWKSLIDYHFGYLISELDTLGIQYFPISEATKKQFPKAKYVVIDLITTNALLKKNVNLLLKDKILQFNKSTGNNNDSFSDIVYISILKGLDRDEMLALNKKIDDEKENEERRKREEQRRKREEEQRIKSRAESIYNNYRRGFVYYANIGKIKSWNSCSSTSDYQKIIEFESQCRIKHEELQKKDRLNQLKGCVKDWHVTRYGIAHDYIYGYLKTSAPREASESEWDIRNLIWAFKNDPGKVNKHYSYNQALDIIIPKYERELKNTFGNYLSDLTLVCIPASSSIKNKRRWEEFAQRVCRDLDMRNAYDYIKITSEAVPRHLGGDGQPSLSFDSAFFKGKYVVLCDDIKTTGASLQRMRERIESLGAEVICSLTIGKTIHE